MFITYRYIIHFNPGQCEYPLSWCNPQFHCWVGGLTCGTRAFIQFIQEPGEHRPVARDDMAQAFRSNDGQRCAFPPLIVNTERGERDNTIQEINESRDTRFCLWDKEARRRINNDFTVQSRM